MRIKQILNRLPIKRTLISAGAALSILLICVLWMNSGLTFAPEETFFGWQVKLKRMTFLRNIRRDDIDPAKVTMIDLSGLKQLVPDPDSSGSTVAITDRQKLSKLLSLLAERGNHHKFAICDVLTDSVSPDQANFAEAAFKVNHILFATSKADYLPVLPQSSVLPVANVQYHTAQGLFMTDHFVKYNYWGATGKSLPLQMEEQLTGKGFSKHTGGLLGSSGSLYLQTALLDFEFRSETPDGNFSSAYILPANEFIGALERNDPGYYDLYCRNKYLLLGDFNTDIHATALGEIPGPVILLNLFLMLHEDHTRISLGWVIFNIILLTPFCYFLLFPQSHRLFERLNSLHHVPLGKLLSVSLVITLWVFLISFLSYLLFNKAFQITPFLVLLAFYEFIKTLWQVVRHYLRPLPLPTAVATNPVQTTAVSTEQSARAKIVPVKKRHKQKKRKK